MNREEQVRIIAKVCCLSNVDCAMKIGSYLKFLLLAVQDKMVRSKDGALCTSCEGREGWDRDLDLDLDILNLKNDRATVRTKKSSRSCQQHS